MDTTDTVPGWKAAVSRLTLPPSLHTSRTPLPLSGWVASGHSHLILQNSVRPEASVLMGVYKHWLNSIFTLFIKNCNYRSLCLHNKASYCVFDYDRILQYNSFTKIFTINRNYQSSLSCMQAEWNMTPGHSPPAGLYWIFPDSSRILKSVKCFLRRLLGNIPLCTSQVLCWL